MQHSIRHRDCTVIDLVRIRSRPTDSLAARQKIGNLLRNAVLRPARLPPSAILYIRTLHDPLPHTRWLDQRRVYLPAEWEASATSELDRFAAQAVRPALSAVPPSAQAVLFLDRAEWLACLAADWLQGTLGINWWWVTLLKQGDADLLAMREWMEAPECAPPALQMLAARSRAVQFLQRLPDNVVASLLERMLQAFSVPSAGRGPENLKQAIPGKSDPGSLRTPKLRAGEIPPGEPWLPYVPEASAPELPPLKRVLLAQALMLRRAPARARSITFQHEMMEWQSWAAALSLSHLVQEQKPGSLGDSRSLPGVSERQALDPAASGEVAESAQAHVAILHTEIPHASASDLVLHREGKLVTVALEPAASGELVPHREGKLVTLALESAPSGEIAEPAEADAITLHTQIPHALAGGLPTVEPEQDGWQAAELASRSAEAFQSVESAFGGVFFLANVALYLKLYGDFTCPRERGLELDFWDFLCLLGLDFVGDEIKDDPVFEILATLAGRTKWQRPGAYFEPPRDWHVPPEWLEPFPETFEKKEVIRGGRLQVIHPAGFLLADESRDACAEPDDPLSSWLSWIAGYIRARLARALGRNDAADFLCRIPAEVECTTTHVNIFYRLETYPSEIRLAGLDRDPGWVPAAGRYVAYYFD